MNVRILVGLLADYTGEDVNVYAYGPQAEAFQDKLIIQTKRRLFWLSRWHRAKAEIKEEVLANNKMKKKNRTI